MCCLGMGCPVNEDVVDRRFKQFFKLLRGTQVRIQNWVKGGGSYPTGNLNIAHVVQQQTREGGW